MKPGRRLIYALLAWAALGALAVLARVAVPGVAEAMRLVWAVGGLLLALAAGIDLLRLWQRPTPEADRHLPAALAVGARQSVRLQIATDGARGRWLIADHHPGDDHDTGLPRRVTLPAGRDSMVLHYPYRPTRRGTVVFGDIEIWLPSPTGFWEQRRLVAARHPVPVYPDFSPIARAALTVHRSRHRFGLRPQPRSGEGLEFRELRPYQPGDSPRRIDWKASSRQRTLISRHFQDEQNQTVWILLDGGRRMALPIGDLTALDHGLNASLLLAWSALRQGDRVGALLFSGHQPRWLQPVRDRRGVQALLRGFFDVQPSDHTSDFSQAAHYLHSRWRRRALVVLVTRLHPEDSDDLLAAVRLLRRRHLVLIADLQLPEQQALHQQPVEDLDSALRLAAAVGEQEQRDGLHTRLHHAGAHLVRATPERLAERLGQAYQHLSSR